MAALLQALEGQVRILDRHGNLDVSINAITDDSRAVSADSLFVAVKGERVDGHEFIPAAVKRGMVALVSQQPVSGVLLPLVRVDDSRKALGLLGSRFYGDPSSHIRMIGVTGTNGKTTTTYVCKALLEALSHPVGLIGTVVYQIGERTMPATQ